MARNFSDGIDQYKQACDAVHEADVELNNAAGDAWQALPLTAKLHVLLGEVARVVGVAVWEIRSATAAAPVVLSGCNSTRLRYRTFRSVDRAAELRYGPGPTSGTAEWTDENRQLALSSTQAAWDAMPLWLRAALCLRCHAAQRLRGVR